MRKVKRYFGARRQWPDSPYRQIALAKWDLANLQQNNPVDYELFHNLQSWEFDAMRGLAKATIPMNEHIVGRLNGGIPRGAFYTTAGYNPYPPMFLTHRLQRELDNGLQRKFMICLEDSYSTPHYKPYDDFDKLTVETPDDPVRSANW